MYLHQSECRGLRSLQFGLHSFCTDLAHQRSLLPTNFMLCNNTRSYVMEYRPRTPVAGVGSEGVWSPRCGHLVVPEH